MRRVILFNIDPVEETLPHIVGRARDTDAINRRVVYLKPLSDIQDFRTLSLDDRNRILKWGLNDRNIFVKKAASTMLSEKWISHANNNLIEFLERLEIMKPEVTEIAEGVFNAFFTARKDIVNEITFDGNFFLNPKKDLFRRINNILGFSRIMEQFDSGKCIFGKGIDQILTKRRGPRRKIR